MNHARANAQQECIWISLAMDLILHKFLASHATHAQMDHTFQANTPTPLVAYCPSLSKTLKTKQKKKNKQVEHATMVLEEMHLTFDALHARLVQRVRSYSTHAKRMLLE